MKTERCLAVFFACICCIYAELMKSEEPYETENEVSENVWSKFDNEILNKIAASKAQYDPLKSGVRSILKKQIRVDFSSFQDGITAKMVESAAPYGTRYQLINHTLYRDKDCLFPSRCEGNEHFLQKLTDLPDFEIVINNRDYPQVSKHFNEKIPVFSFSKTEDYADIMYPAWSFWCGGPAIRLYPTGIGRWDKLRKLLMKEAEHWPWEAKKDKGFFRGSRTTSERDELIYLSRESPDLIDAAYTKNQAWKSAKDTLNAEPAPEVSFEEHCHYKYLFNFRGVAASFRYKHLFLCKSLVFHVGDEWKEFFYDVLKPWVHYVPIKKDYTRKDIRDILIFFHEHDALAREIAENGYNLIKDHLKLSHVKWYWKNLLEEYTRLQKFTPTLNSALKKVTQSKSHA